MVLGTQEGTAARRGTLSGMRAPRCGLLTSPATSVGGRKELKPGEAWSFEVFPVSFEHILWEAQEVGKPASAWIYFLIGKRKKGNMTSKFNFIVMLMAGPLGNRYPDSETSRTQRVLGTHLVQMLWIPLPG